MKQIYVHGLGQTSDSWTKTIDILQWIVNTFSDKFF